MIKLTAVHHTAGKLSELIGQRKWHIAYQVADELDSILATEGGADPTLLWSYCKVSDLAEERFKRVAYANG